MVQNDDANTRTPRQLLDHRGDFGGIEVRAYAVSAVSEQPAIADANCSTSRDALDEVGRPCREWQPRTADSPARDERKCACGRLNGAWRQGSPGRNKSHWPVANRRFENGGTLFDGPRRRVAPHVAEFGGVGSAAMRVAVLQDVQLQSVGFQPDCQIRIRFLTPPWRWCGADSSMNRSRLPPGAHVSKATSGMTAKLIG